MADRVVHVHEDSDRGNGNANFLIGIILLIVLAVLFFMYGLPALNGMSQNTGVTVPEQVDVNINQPNGQ